MRSFAIEDPGSPDPPLYATLLNCKILFFKLLVGKVAEFPLKSAAINLVGCEGGRVKQEADVVSC